MDKEYIYIAINDIIINKRKRILKGTICFYHDGYFRSLTKTGRFIIVPEKYLTEDFFIMDKVNEIIDFLNRFIKDYSLYEN